MALLLATSLSLGILSFGTACAGPKLHIKNPDEHDVFLDGRQVHKETQNYRYYGTSRWDTLPLVREDNGVPVFDSMPNSETVEIPAPASPYLFPFDFPLEVLSRTAFGRPDQTVTVTVIEKPPEQRIGLEIPGEELGKLSARGRQARIQR